MFTAYNSIAILENNAYKRIVINTMTIKKSEELSDEKTLITKATDKARFIGYDIRVTPKSNHKKKTKRGIKWKIKFI